MSTLFIDVPRGGAFRPRENQNRPLGWRRICDAVSMRATKIGKDELPVLAGPRIGGLANLLPRDERGTRRRHEWSGAQARNHEIEPCRLRRGDDKSRSSAAVDAFVLRGDFQQARALVRSEDVAEVLPPPMRREAAQRILAAERQAIVGLEADSRVAFFDLGRVVLGIDKPTGAIVSRVGLARAR